MKVKTDYNGQDIWVDEDVKKCLDELEKEEKAQNRRNRRHELLWDSIMIKEIDYVKDDLPIEEEVIDSLYKKAIEKLVQGLDDLDRKLIIDRFINRLKYSEMVNKYELPDSTINSRIKRIIAKIKSALNDALKNK